MKRVRIAELKDRLSQVLRDVEQGQEIEVTHRTRPIARLVPVERLRSVVSIRPARRPFAQIRRMRSKPAGWPVDSLDLLLEERRDR